MTGIKNRHCSICDITFTTRKSYLHHELHSHKTEETPIIDLKSRHCDVCKKKYSVKGYYLRHLNEAHGIILPDVHVEPSDLELKGSHCKACDIRYKHRKNFTVHLREVHGIESPSRFDSVTITNGQKNYCATCDRTYGNRLDFVHHLITIHPEKKAEIYQGIDCEFPSRDDLKFHRYCTDCKKVFLSRNICRIHWDKMHGSEPLKKLINGDGIDINDPNNYCASCDRTYYCMSTYRRHLKRVHHLYLSGLSRKRATFSNITFVLDHLKKYCNVCKRKYKSADSYQVHIYKYHYKKSLSTEELSTSTANVRNGLTSSAPISKPPISTNLASDV